MIKMLIIFTKEIMIVAEIRLVIMAMVVGMEKDIIKGIITGIIMVIIVEIIKGTIIMRLVIQTVNFGFIHITTHFKIIVKMGFILNFSSILTHSPSIHLILLNHSFIYFYPYSQSITNSLSLVPLILVVYSELIIPLGLSHSIHIVILHELIHIIRLRIEITLLTCLLKWCLPIIHSKIYKILYNKIIPIYIN